MKSICLILLGLLSMGFVYAQDSAPFEGKITYEISYPGMEELDPTVAGFLPTESVTYIKGTNQRVEMPGPMGMNSVTIVDGKTQKYTVLMNQMGNKTATVYNQNDPKSESKPEVVLTSETKKIAGYNCKKALIKVKGQKEDMILYYTDEIVYSSSPAAIRPEFAGIKGFPMEFEISQDQMKIRMTVKEVKKQPIADNLFIVPADYKVVEKK